MKPKEKAKELVDKFNYESKHYLMLDSKQCALLVVDEILWEIIKYADNSKEYVIENAKFWQEVKQEITNI